MKVLILSGSDKIGTAESITAVCTDSGAEPFTFGSSGSCNSGLYSCLESNDLVLIIWDDEMIQKHEITFSTGYCVGKGKPFVLYRENNQVLPLCNGKAVVISKKEDLKLFLIREVKKNTEQLSKEAAKSKITEMGHEISIRDFVEVVFKGEILAVSQFIKAGYSPNRCDKNGVFLLNIAARNGHLKTAAILIDNGAEINSVSGDRGNTPVMDAAAEDNIEILSRLISAGALLDIKSKSGQTALILAIGCHAEDTALTLIEAGADIDIKDDLGMTAKKYAGLFKLERVLSLMDKDNR